MAIGPHDYIDQMLAKKYSTLNANNMDDKNRLDLSQEKYWEYQKEIAQVHRTLMMVGIQMKKKVAGTALNRSASPA